MIVKPINMIIETFIKPMRKTSFPFNQSFLAKSIATVGAAAGVKKAAFEAVIIIKTPTAVFTSSVLLNANRIEVIITPTTMLFIKLVKTIEIINTTTNNTKPEYPANTGLNSVITVSRIPVLKCNRPIKMTSLFAKIK